MFGDPVIRYKRSLELESSKSIDVIISANKNNKRIFINNLNNKVSVLSKNEFKKKVNLLDFRENSTEKIRGYDTWGFAHNLPGIKNKMDQIVKHYLNNTSIKDKKKSLGSLKKSFNDRADRLEKRFVLFGRKKRAEAVKGLRAIANGIDEVMRNMEKPDSVQNYHQRGIVHYKSVIIYPRSNGARRKNAMGDDESEELTNRSVVVDADALSVNKTIEAGHNNQLSQGSENQSNQTVKTSHHSSISRRLGDILRRLFSFVKLS